MSRNEHFAAGAGVQPLYHGSARRLVRGSVITPPSKHGGEQMFPTASHVDHAYATPHMHVAAEFALNAHGMQEFRGKPYVYKVEPVGHVEPDHDGIADRDVRSRDGFKVVDWVPKTQWAKAHKKANST